MSHVDPDECTAIECYVLDQSEEAVKVLFADPDGREGLEDIDSDEAQWIPKSLMSEAAVDEVEIFVGTSEVAELEIATWKLNELGVI